MKKLLSLLALLPSLALADLTTGGVSGWDATLAYTKPAFYPITVPTEASAPNKYYVNFSGGSGSTCSLASPCDSLSDLAGKTGMNGIGGATYVYVKGNGGRLDTTGLTLKGADASNPLVIKPWPGDSTVTTWTASGSCGTGVANTIDDTGGNVRYVVFDGGPDMLLRFVGASSCSGNDNSSTVVTRSDDVTLYRVRINNNGAGGSPLAPANGNGTNQANFRLINSELYGATTGTNSTYGVYVGGGAGCDTENSGFTNMEFRNNIIRDARGRGIQIEPRSRGGNVSSGLVISGNAFRNIGKGRISHAVEMASACGASVSGSVVVSNNLMWDLGGGGVLIPSWSGASFQIYNNTIWDYGKNTAYSLSSHGITCINDPCTTSGVRNNIIMGMTSGANSAGVNPINRNPTSTGRNLCDDTPCGSDSRSGTVVNTFQSTSTASANFLKLLSTSTGVGGVLTNFGLTIDYFGNVRPSGGGYDIGAAQATVGSPVDPPPTLTLNTSNANPNLAQTFTLTWVVGGGGATSCTASGAWSGAKNPAGGQEQIVATATGTYTLVCTGTGGSSPIRSQTVSVAAPLVSLSASFPIPYEGQNATVTWSVTNGTPGTCTATGTIAAWTASPSKATTVGPNTQPNVAIPSSGTVGLSCTSTAGTTVASSVNIFASPLPPPPVITFYATPTSVTVGDPATLTWSATGSVGTCTGSGATQGDFATWNATPPPTSPWATGNLAADAPYTLTCTSSVPGVSSASQSLTVAAVAAPPTPTVDLTISPTSVLAGYPYDVTWQSTNATSCTRTAGPWASGTAVAPNGTDTRTDTPPLTYSIECTGPGGTRSDSADINLTPPPPTPVETVFTGQIGATPILSGSSHPAGTVIRLVWVGYNATSCEATGDYVASGLGTANNHVMPALTGDIQVTMTCTDGVTTDAETLTFYMDDPVVIPTASISINPTSQLAGVAYAVTWACTDSDAATSSWSGAVATSGTVNLTTTPPQTHTITCTDTGSSTSRNASATVNLIVPDPPINLNFSAGTGDVTDYASQTAVANGATLATGVNLFFGWVADFADDCAASGDWVDASTGKIGIYDFGAISGDVEVTLTCSNASHTEVKTLNFYEEVVVDPPPDPAPTLTFSVSPLNVTQGLSSVLTWDSTYATSCQASLGWSGTKAPDGTETTDALGKTTRFRMTCIGTGGSVTKETAVTVQRTTSRPRCRWWRCR